MNKTEYLLTTLAEECAEVAQRACKALRFGLSEIQPGQPDDNKRRLERELADLMATAEMLGLVIRDEDKAAKADKLKMYMEYSHKVGTLERYLSGNRMPESLNEARSEADYPKIGSKELCGTDPKDRSYVCDCCRKHVSAEAYGMDPTYWHAETMNPKLVVIKGVVYFGCSTECARILFDIHSQYALLG